MVLTVDLAAVVGQRYRDGRNGISGKISRTNRARRGADLFTHTTWVRDVALGGRPLKFGNHENALPDANVPGDFQAWVAGQFDPSVTWDDLAWLREHWRGKIALKGILDPDDARAALDHGADAVIVSNHGGRQLDRRTLHHPRAAGYRGGAVGDQCEVLMDGGIRSGLDVVKAMSMGARACLIGRAWAYAVAARGERGVYHILRILQSEMMVTLGLTGVNDVRDLDRTVVEEQ